MPEPTKLILKAAKSGDVKAVKMLLATDPTLIDARDSDGSTPLHCATWKGHHNVVAALLEAEVLTTALSHVGSALIPIEHQPFEDPGDTKQPGHVHKNHRITGLNSSLERT